MRTWRGLRVTWSKLKLPCCLFWNYWQHVSHTWILEKEMHHMNVQHGMVMVHGTKWNTRQQSYTSVGIFGHGNKASLRCDTLFTLNIITMSRWMTVVIADKTTEVIKQWRGMSVTEGRHHRLDDKVHLLLFSLVNYYCYFWLQCSCTSNFQ